MLHGFVPIAKRQFEIQVVYGDLSQSIGSVPITKPFENALGARLRYFLSDHITDKALLFPILSVNVWPPARDSFAGFDVACLIGNLNSVVK